MSTKVYGRSDDLIEFDGDVSGEVGSYGTDDAEKGVLVFFDDGTVAEVKYGKNDLGIWGINVRHKGALFKSLIPCDDADAEMYSDILTFKDGLKWAYAAKDDWEKVA